LREQAANALLDRGYGKPAQQLLATVNAEVLLGGIDSPPPILEETDSEWLERRRGELAQLAVQTSAPSVSSHTHRLTARPPE
jgi:hypothetical protein